MTRRSLLVAAFAVGSAAFGNNEEKEERLSGTVQRIDRDSSVITLDGGSFRRQVLYTGETKIKYRKKPGNAEEIREGQRIVARGKFNDKLQLLATSLELHEGK